MRYLRVSSHLEAGIGADEKVAGIQCRGIQRWSAETVPG
jgi:hypothetical protein